MGEMTYQPKLPLHKHQLDALQACASKPRAPSDQDVFAYLLDMGTGKSALTLAEFGERELASELHDLLIVAPAGSYLNWCNDKSDALPSEFKKHLSDNLFNRLAYAPWISGNKVSVQQRLRALLNTADQPRALLVNVEALSTVTAAQVLCTQFLNAPGRRSMMVVDESTAIRGDSNRADMVMRLGQLANVRRILTGLVAPKSPLDLYRQFTFLDWRIIGHRSFYSFRARYATMKKMSYGGRSFDVVTGYKNVEELQRKIAPYSYRVLKDDVLDLPPKVYLINPVPLSDEQQRMYHELKQFATSAIEEGGHVTATSVITQIIRLHQLTCGYVVNEQDEIQEVQSNRLDHLMRLIDAHDGKAIIWASYQHSIKQIATALAKRYGANAVAQYYGLNRSTRDDDERRFLSDPRCRFMVSTPAAGGKGNTWINASLVVYYANNYDLELRMQSEDRAHRDGLKHEVRYVDLVAEGTVDEVILKALRRKINMATAITGENWKEWVV